MLPDFLNVDDVLAIHHDQIERYGGSPELRDAGILDSAVQTPRATFEGMLLHTDLFEIGAAYLFHIVQNHPFVDGNKRTGTASTIVFLELNGIDIRADEDALVELVLAVAQGQRGKPEISAFFRQHTAR